jgi:hypothetical protein
MLLECDKPQLLMVDVQERLLPVMSDPTLVLKNGGRLQDSGVPLATTEMVLFEWLRRAGTPEFKTISRLIR